MVWNVGRTHATIDYGHGGDVHLVGCVFSSPGSRSAPLKLVAFVDRNWECFALGCTTSRVYGPRVQRS